MIWRCHSVDDVGYSFTECDAMLTGVLLTFYRICCEVTEDNLEMKSASSSERPVINYPWPRYDGPEDGILSIVVVMTLMYRHLGFSWCVWQGRHMPSLSQKWPWPWGVNVETLNEIEQSCHGIICSWKILHLYIYIYWLRNTYFNYVSL